MIIFCSIHPSHSPNGKVLLPIQIDEDVMIGNALSMIHNVLIIHIDLQNTTLFKI